MAPVLIGDFEGDSDGGGATVGVEDFGKPGWRDSDLALGQLDRSDARQAKESGVRDAVELSAD